MFLFQGFPRKVYSIFVCIYFFLRLQEAEIYYISDLMGTENAAEFVRMWYVGVGIFSSAGVNY